MTKEEGNKKHSMKDWKLNEIKDGDILETQQGTKFVVDFMKNINRWTIIQSNAAGTPDLQGQRFELAEYMQPNLEIIGNIYTTPKLID